MTWDLRQRAGAADQQSTHLAARALTRVGNHERRADGQRLIAGNRGERKHRNGHQSPAGCL